MARVFTPVDASAILAATVREATGQELTLQSINTSNFASIGESLLLTGKENVLNALSTVLFRDIIAVRPYTAKFKTLRAESSDLFMQRKRKISYYAKDPKASGAFNTNLWENFKNGYTNGQNIDSNGVPQSTKSMWEQDPPLPMEIFFGGSSVWADSYQVFEVQLDVAFKSPENLAQFANGYIQEKMNDIESQKEAFARLNLLNYIAGVADQSAYMPGSFRNLTSEFNTKFGTSYTTTQLQTTYFKEFLEFFVETVKNDIDRLSNRSALYHDPRTQTIDGIDYSVLRHTPTNKMRMLMYAPFWNAAEARVLPEIFHEGMLELKNFEKVGFWQNENDPSAIDVTPAVYDRVNGVQIAGNQIQLDYVIGTIHDIDALMVDFQLERVASTPLEARKLYRNIWYNMARNNICDFTEKGIVYVMFDPTP